MKRVWVLAMGVLATGLAEALFKPLPDPHAGSVISDAVLSKHLRKNKGVLKSSACKDLMENDSVLYPALGKDSAFFRFRTVSVAAPKGFSSACAVLGLLANDIATAPPNAVAVIAHRGDKTYFTSKEVSLPPNPKCTAKFEKDEAAIQWMMEKYRKSDLNDQKAFSDYQKAGEDNFRKYARCYADALSRRGSMGEVEKAAQGLADSLSGLP